MKRGFTLVELSIVLVIIGLLIGGILVAQSMTSTAKIQSFIRQVGQYDAAIANFQTRYNKIPGCAGLAPLAGGLPCTSPTSYDGSGYSSMRAWPELSLGLGMLSATGQNYTYVDGFSAFSQANCPNTPLDHDTTTSSCLFITYGAIGGYYRYQESPLGAAPTYHPMRTPDAIAIDTKLDDGIGYDSTQNGGGKVSIVWGNANCGVTSGGKTVYVKTYTGYACTLQIQVGILSGSVTN